MDDLQRLVRLSPQTRSGCSIHHNLELWCNLIGMLSTTFVSTFVSTMVTMINLSNVMGNLEAFDAGEN